MLSFISLIIPSLIDTARACFVFCRPWLSSNFSSCVLDDKNLHVDTFAFSKHVCALLFGEPVGSAFNDIQCLASTKHKPKRLRQEITAYGVLCRIITNFPLSVCD